jgi:hypothetical protein
MADSAANINFTSVPFDDSIDDRQPQPNSFAFFFCRIKRVENFRQVLFRDAISIVSYFQNKLVRRGVCCCSNDNLAVGLVLGCLCELSHCIDVADSSSVISTDTFINFSLCERRLTVVVITELMFTFVRWVLDRREKASKS